MTIKLTPRWKQVLFAVFRPRFWLTGYRFSQQLDHLIQKSILNNQISNDGTGHVCDDRMPYNIIIKDVGKVWIQNYPYAYGSIEG